MLYLIDSYAWVEYFLGSPKGKILQALLREETNQFLTVVCCLAEIKGWSLRNKKDFVPLLKIIHANSTLVSVQESDWVSAADIRFTLRKEKKHFGLIDAVILVKQKEHQGRVISGDHHFKGLPEVLFL